MPDLDTNLKSAAETAANPALKTAMHKTTVSFFHLPSFHNLLIKNHIITLISIYVNTTFCCGISGQVKLKFRRFHPKR